MLGTKRVEAVIVSWQSAALPVMSSTRLGSGLARGSDFEPTVYLCKTLPRCYSSLGEQIVYLSPTPAASSMTWTFEDAADRNAKLDQGPATGDHTSSAYHA